MSSDPPSTASRGPITGEHAVALFDMGFHTLVPDEPALSEDECEDHPGDMISRYRLVEPLGEGGFGYVWSAEQLQPIQRAIALKLIRRGMNSREIIARFAAESQALALMDHPNIAAVLDAGATADGRPFFAMELVKGEPLVSYCNSRGLGLRERIELFIPVCQAVQHAHQKAILHRDLKPSNILVAEIDGKPVAKVIDFGIAKALAATPPGALDASLLQTRAGAILGTLPYMSPEQAGSVTDVDTRSDIYSLGVILYELLTGSTPLAAGAPVSEAYDETLRRIRTQEALRPSSLTHGGGEQLKSRRALRGDLDWIAMKALEKDRRRRYETATALAADLRRYLDREPVSAAAPTWSYQFSKFARRNRVVFASAALVAAAMITGTTVSLQQASRAKHESENADASRREAERNRALAEANLAKARGATDQFLNKVADDPRLREADFLELRRSLLESALPFYEELSANDGAGLSFSAGRGSALNRLGLLYQELGRPDKSLGAFRQAVEASEALVAAEPRNPEHREALLAACNNLASMLDVAGDREAALAAQARSVEVARKLSADYPENAEYRENLVTLLMNSGQMLARSGKHEEAMPMIREALAASEALVKDFPEEPAYRSLLGNVHANFAGVLNHANQPGVEQEFLLAKGVQEQLLQEEPSSRGNRDLLATTCMNLGHIMTFSGRWDEALVYLREAMTHYDRLAQDLPSVPEYRSSSARCRMLMGMSLLNLGRSWEAEPELQESIAAQHRLGEEFPADDKHATREGVALEVLAKLKRKAGDTANARQLYEASIECHRRALAARPDDVESSKFIAERWHSLAQMALDEGDAAQAVRNAREIPVTFPGRWEEYSAAARLVAQAVARVLTQQELPESERMIQAEQHAAVAVELLQKAIDARYPYVPELANDPDFEPLRVYPSFAALKEPPPEMPGAQPERFVFDYPYDDPGPRNWKREGDHWTETQPSGRSSEFRVVGRIRLRGVSGTEIEHLTEPDFHLFIPDRNTPDTPKLSMRRGDTPWAGLGDLRNLK
ncbi:serine/threonine-protein kinase [Haloferula sp. BvORR071]|uniref:serine/threonine-protein kinase n=1 Tax=Haloferula sp. BvORR071 TaxID=1396141 RepID=UPI0006988638|nr:serine/threonine-protein kinase [Haloferula sp. BvORR071]